MQGECNGCRRGRETGLCSCKSCATRLAARAGVPPRKLLRANWPFPDRPGDELRTDDSLAKIFWSIDPVGAECFRAIAESLENADSFQATRIEHLLKHSPRGPIY